MYICIKFSVEMGVFEILLIILKIVGGLGLFLFGMKLMSEALQKAAGRRLRRILEKLTNQRGKGFLTGMVSTGLIQSSSATTVMLVSFVNAGLLSVAASIPVILGANIGTTLKFWVISYLGFGVDLSNFILPLIGLAFPLYFSKRSRTHLSGEFLFGFALLFLGIYFMNQSMPNLSDDVALKQIILSISSSGFFSTLLFVFAGLILTIIVQSSSATMTLTVVLAYQGFIDFPAAAAMVLGENIGTTATANIAALIANTSARRTALAHFFFNIFAAIPTLILFYPIQKGVAGLTETLWGLNPANSLIIIPFALALFHTSFNVVFAILILPFTHYLEAFVNLFFRKKSNEDFKLRYFSSALLSTSEISLVQVNQETAHYSGLINQSLFLFPLLLIENKSKKHNKLIDKLNDFETNRKSKESEISDYITLVSESDLSREASESMIHILELMSNLEYLSENINKTQQIINDKNQNKIWFSPEMRDETNSLLNKIIRAYECINKQFQTENKEIDNTSLLDLLSTLEQALILNNSKQWKNNEVPAQSIEVFNQLLNQFNSIAKSFRNLERVIFLRR